MKLLILLFPLFVFSQNIILPEKWIEPDKEKHLLAGAGIGFFTTGVTYSLTDNKILSASVGTGLSYLIAHLKEKNDPVYSNPDLRYTGISGAICSVSFVLLSKK